VLVEILIILVLSLLPALISIVLLRKAKQRWQIRLRRARTMTIYRQPIPLQENNVEPEEENLYHFIGNLDCRYNARSPFIRCAVNPSGPCENCPHFETK
jgi:hypothetical protein